MAVVSGAIVVYGLSPWALGRSQPPSLPAQGGVQIGIVWANRVFLTQDELSGWLRSRGSSYAEWAVNHPVEQALLEGRAPPESASASPALPATADTSRGHVSLFSGIWLLACVLMAAAMLLFERRGIEPPPRRLPSQRLRDIDSWMGGAR
jgi:hypothetical protein